MKLGWESDNKERNRVIELFRLGRDSEGLVKEYDEYIVLDNDKHLPLGFLVVADNFDNDVTHLGITINTNGDWTKNTNSDMDYEKIIMGVTWSIIIMVDWKK